MLAEMAVSLAVADVLAADVAHLVSTDAGEFVATRGFHKGHVAARTGALDGQGHGLLYLGAESHEGRFVADVDVGPGLAAGYAGWTATAKILADEFEAALLSAETSN